ncbi:2OG-Fe dioxygenase family protein [Acidovorax sp. NCPPB 3576]|uniref:2OG-Fe dioxygenase family protein n=1 Tax=Acidovorax sp. NCPPB 3576 TaxID=2940488 RepID=UPI0023499D6D|nr:2OG-Fe dioxygenase family protein [Acidovorax sp. NCPPB 3576]WCM88676.1 2OG-Fe dioxygenase family protein [Acidovorax sp. NCPPB 3576]
MDFKKQNYARFTVPPLSEQAMREFDTLAFDPYTGGKQRYRRFSQFKVGFEGGEWRTELLPHRPFIQSKNYNGVVGGVQRQFEPIRFDPTPQVAAGALAAQLDTRQVFQINVHQVRVVANADIPGVTVPEGPHRDGHDFVMNAIFARHNITGGVSQLMPTGGGPCFFEDILQENEAIIVADDQMWHNATHILPKTEAGGHRDILIISFNAWERRRYGEEFERRHGAIAIDEAVPA